MKNRSLARAIAATLTLVALALPAGAVPPTREELTKTFESGVAAFAKEDLAAAERQFRKVLQHVPQHAPSRRYLIDIERIRKKVASIPAMEKELSTLTVPEVKVDEVTLEDFLALVALKTKELSGGKTVPNFVFRPSTPEMTDRVLTLTLNSVPASELLRQAGLLTRTKFTYEKYAIVVTPTQSAGADPATSAALDAAAKESDGE